LEEKDLFLYGFLYSLVNSEIKFGEDAPDCSVGKKSCRAVKQLISEKYQNQPPPLIILDEFSLRGKNYERLRFLRKAITVTDCRLAIMGTDSTASNVVTISLASSNDENHIWCTIIFDLPSFIMPPEHPFTDTSNSLFVKVLENSRPLFSTLALEFAAGRISGPIDSAKLLEIAQVVGRRSSERKRISSNLGGRHGQISMFLAASFLEETKDESALMVHQHFGKFDIDTPSFQVNCNMSIIGTLEKWTPWNRMPTPKEDLLLHLCLSGIPGVPALFDEKGKETYFAKAAESLFSDVNSSRYQIRFTNPDQTSNDGMKLEAFAAAAICKASHCLGYGGCPALQFIKQLFYELTGYLLDSDPLFWKSFSDDLDVLKDCIIPFMSPPNSEWPEWLSDLEGGNFGNLFRTCNQSRIDLRCKNLNSDETILSGETKDYKSRLDSTVMEKILLRIPSASKLHIVVTNHLQDKYFTTKPFEQSFQGEHALNCSYYRLSRNSKQCGSISGLTDASSPKTVVLFIEQEK
jgi:hypothetical protein